MFKVKRKNVLYEVNEKEGYVKCTIRDGAHKCVSQAAYHFFRKTFNLAEDGELFRKTLMRTEYTAIAKLCPGDTWDEDAGKELAFVRLRAKVMHAYFNALQRGFDTISCRFNAAVPVVDEYGSRLSKLDFIDRMKLQDKIGAND